MTTPPSPRPSSHWLASAPPLPELEISPLAAARAEARARFRACAWGLLGDFPDHGRPRQVEHLETRRQDGYRCERFSFDDGCGCTVPGVCYLPEGSGPFPAVLWCHWHGGDYPLGTEAMGQAVHTPEAPGPALARRGFVVLGVDAPGFGRRHGQGPDGLLKGDGEASLAKHGLLYGRTLWGLTLHDDLCALALLAARPEVDAGRIGTAGISMGCLRALWLAALDERLRATVAICCLTRMQDLIADGGLHRHGIYYYVPGMLRHFDIEGVLAAIAPRALLALNGELDGLTPPAGVRSAERLARPAWDLEGAGDLLRIGLVPGVGHAWTPEMWAESLAWLDRHLA